MNLEEMRRRKRELGYSNKRIAELSGVPLGTVQKIFSGATKAPREESLKYIWRVLGRRPDSYAYGSDKRISEVREDSLAYEYADESGIPDVLIDARTRNWRRQGTYTIADYDLLPEEFRVELIDGVFYDPETPDDTDVLMLASPMQKHQHLAGSIYSELLIYTSRHHPECLPMIAPVSVKLEKSDTTLVEPDVFVVCDKNKLDGRIVNGAPDLIVEVLSKSTMSKDQQIKLNKYWRAGVREYWIVDPFRTEIIVYHFSEGTPPDIYTFSDIVPVGLSGGELEIDFRAIYERMKLIFGD
ncbi:MAG: Uma2 family endonuclease [Mogibacterium sp.]|nr:Uma2 family endonuclease [Mogibacterium sp.]